jgi:hypothetical protein
MRKRREVDCSKLEVWRVTFERGRDYFSDLAAREVGADFMAQWVPGDTDDKPWALMKFGPPDSA